MKIINQNFLQEIGLELSEDAVNLLSDHFETTLNERIMNEITEELDQEQAEELLAMIERDDPTISEWLGANIPELKEIIQDEVDILVGELVQAKDSL